MPDIIVTADDLGSRPDHDDAIFAAAERGIVTSASVMTNGAAYAAASRRVLEAALDHGVHLNVLDGEPLSPRAEVRSLLGADGRFLGSLERFLRRYAAGAVRTDEIALEWERQVRRALDDGLTPSHLNGHYHLHALPGLWTVGAELARRFRIRWIRVPSEPPWHATSLRGGLRAAPLWALSAPLRASLARRRIGALPCRGVVHSGHLGIDAWRRVLDRLDAPTTEIMCHPGQGWRDTEAVLSPALRREIDARVTRRSFRDLVSP